MHYPPLLLKLIHVLRKLPGVGTKSAERFAFDLLEWNGADLQEMASLIGTLQEKLRYCSVCGCLLCEETCSFCASPYRDKSLLCIVASPRDIFSVEQTKEYKGLYHILGGLLSPIEGRGPGQLKMHSLKDRIIAHQIKEVVIALDSTLEGDATALFLKKELNILGVAMVSRLAFGLPMGSSLEYVDGGTLAKAFAGRSRF